jgi:hypothetical protein
MMSTFTWRLETEGPGMVVPFGVLAPIADPRGCAQASASVSLFDLHL